MNSDYVHCSLLYSQNDLREVVQFVVRFKIVLSRRRSCFAWRIRRTATTHAMVETI